MLAEHSRRSKSSTPMANWKLNEAAVVVRAKDGRVEVKDEIPGFRLERTATGGLLGLLIGILGGTWDLDRPGHGGGRGLTA
jgi:hypothetical protein